MPVSTAIAMVTARPSMVKEVSLHMHISRKTAGSILMKASITQSTKVEFTSVHEIGHAIGLHHSDVKDSIMWPSYKGYTSDLRLHNDDITGIQSLYGIIQFAFDQQA